MRIVEIADVLASLLEFDNVAVNPFIHANVLAYMGCVEQASELFELTYEHEKARLKTMPEMLRIIDAMRLAHKVRVALANEEFAKAFRTFNKIPQDLLPADPQIVRDVAEIHCYRGLEKGVDTKLGNKSFVEGLALYELYERIGGRSSLKEEHLAFCWTEIGIMSNAVEVIESGLAAAAANHDVESMTRLSLMAQDLIDLEEPLCNLDGKKFSRRISLVERIEWMRLRFSEGADGVRQILEKTCRWKPESITKLEAGIIARAAAVVLDNERCRRICDAMGHDDDGNVLRLMSLALCSFSDRRHEEASELVMKVLKLLDDADADADSADIIVMECFGIIGEQTILSKDVNLLFNFFDHCPVMHDSVMLRMMAAETVMKLGAGNLQSAAKAACVFLDGVHEHERIPLWHLMTGSLKLASGDCAKALKIFEEGRDKVVEMNKEVGEDLFSKEDEHNQELLEQFESQIDFVKNVKSCGGSIRGYMEHEAKAFMERSGFSVLRVLKQSDGPVLMVCTHEAEKGIARIVACDRNSVAANFNPGPDRDSDEEIPNKGRVLSISIPLTDAARIKPADWRVQLICVIGGHLMTNDVGLCTEHTLRIADGTTFSGSKFTGVAITNPAKLPLPKEGEAIVIELVPLYEEELDYASIFTVEKLFKRLVKIDYIPTTRQRQNVCADGNWKPLIAKEKLRPIVEPPLGAEFAFVSKYILLEGRDVGCFFRRDEESDFSGWVFLAEGQRPDDEDLGETMAQTDLNAVANFAPYVVPWLEAAPQSAFVHEGNGVIRQIDYADLKYAESDSAPRILMS